MEENLDSSQTDVTVNNTDANEVHNKKLGKLRVALLYVLIGGLVTSALISVAAILIGEFNESILKALATTIMFVIHSLLVLAIVFVDTNNRLGKSIISTTILTVVIANLLTVTFGIWELWPNDASWKALQVYMLILGAAYMAAGVLWLKLKHTATKIFMYCSIAFVMFLTLLLAILIIDPQGKLIVDFFFRLMGATAILASTSLILTVIINRIALNQKPELKPVKSELPVASGMLAINIIAGVLVGMFWFYGVTAILIRAMQEQTQSETYQDSYYDQNNNYYY